MLFANFYRAQSITKTTKNRPDKYAFGTAVHLEVPGSSIAPRAVKLQDCMYETDYCPQLFSDA